MSFQNQMPTMGLPPLGTLAEDLSPKLYHRNLQARQHLSTLVNNQGNSSSSADILVSRITATTSGLDIISFCSIFRCHFCSVVPFSIWKIVPLVPIGNNRQSGTKKLQCQDLQMVIHTVPGPTSNLREIISIKQNGVEKSWF